MSVKGYPEKQNRTLLEANSNGKPLSASEHLFDYNCKLLGGMRIQREWS
jgi:hypothetical protein